MKDAVILDKADYEGMIERQLYLETEVERISTMLDERLINRAYVMRVTGWCRSTLRNYDKKHGIFEGRKQIPFSKFNKIFESIFDTRGSRPRSVRQRQ